MNSPGLVAGAIDLLRNSIMKLNVITHFALVGLFGIAAGCSHGASDAHADQGQNERRVSRVADARNDADPAAVRADPASRQQRSGQDEVARSGGTLQHRDGNGAGEWTLYVKPDATVYIQFEGAPIVTASYISWGEKPQMKWAMSRFKATPIENGRGTLTGEIPDLGITARGTIRAVAENEMRFDYQVDTSRPLPDILGACLDWQLRRDSPAFRDVSVGEPRLLDGKTGWVWTVGPGQTLEARFDQPLDEMYFEHNQNNNPRGFLVAGRVLRGRRHIGLTVRLPKGGRIVPSPEQAYGAADTSRWFRGALAWNAVPVDLSYLNAGERPAGRHGFLKADGDRFVFEDGTRARFWGGNLAGPALFSTPRENIPRQAHRIAQLGYNLMRIVQVDADWVKPNIFGRDYRDTRRLDPTALDAIDLWIKCLKDEGVYVWLDMCYLRPLKPGDGISRGWAEIQRSHSHVFGFSYFNQDVLNLMKEFQREYLSHVNRYTHLAYKDDPAVAGILITNENDLTFHFGNNMLPNHGNSVHNAVFTSAYRAFAQAKGLPEARVFQTWLPGPSKYFLNDAEHQFNRAMIDDLRSLGVKAPIATTNFWGQACGLYSLPALTDGDVIDVHSYGAAEALTANPRYVANFVSWIGTAQVSGKPLSVTEWNVPYETIDRFTAPLYVASIACLQGWDMVMLYNYAQVPLKAPGPAEWEARIDKWSTHVDPALCGVMPAAALAFRQGHIQPAGKNYYLKLEPGQLLGQNLNPDRSATIRSLVEQSRLTIGIPAVDELPWLKASDSSGDGIIVTDPDHDHIPAGQSVVHSDTGELARNWKDGIQTIDTPKTQAVSGWIGGKTLSLRDASFEFRTRKATVALSSIDDAPLASSRFLLITTVARALPGPATHMGKPMPNRAPGHLPFRSEPVVGTITLRTKTEGLELLALGADGKVVNRTAVPRSQDTLTIRLPAAGGTHWYVLKTRTSKPVERTEERRPSP
jgi:hypothetical protein